LHTGTEAFNYPGGGVQAEYGSGVRPDVGYGLGDARGWVSQSTTNIQDVFAEHAMPPKRKHRKKATAVPLEKETAPEVEPSGFSITEIE